MMRSSLALFLFVMAARLSAQAPAYVPTVGLQGYWPFTNNANDVSGNNNHGTVSGALPATDRFNAASGAYAFNGSSSYISTNMTGILANNPRAVGFWARSTNSVSTMCGVSWGDESPTPGIRYECAFSEGGEGVSIIGSNSACTYSAPSKIYDDSWHYYIYQFAGGGTGQLDQVEVYQDGVLLNTLTYQHNPTTVLNTVNTWPVNFGYIPYVIPHYFQGSLDDIGIWSRTLTPCERHELQVAAKTSISFSPSSPTICKGQSVTITASGVSSYTWNTGAQTTGISVSPSVTTVYNVSGTGPAGCTAAKSITVTVQPCTALEEEKSRRISIFPNPNEGAFVVVGAQAGEILILNALGQAVRGIELKATGDRVEISELPAGIYFVVCGEVKEKIIVSK
jgi:trimeric autotransporter adhesin